MISYPIETAPKLQLHGGGWIRLLQGYGREITTQRWSNVTGSLSATNL